MYLNYINW